MMRVSMAIVFAVCILISCNSNSGNPKQLVVASDTASVKYQCPMQCQGDTAYTTEGKCPVCKMDLEKADAKTLP